MKLSRRELAATALAAVMPSSAEAQAPSSSAAPADIAKTVHDANQRNSETLAKYEIPIATEPAFQFKA